MYAADFLPRTAGPARKAIVVLTAVAAGITLVFGPPSPPSRRRSSPG